MSVTVKYMAVALGDLVAPRHCLVCGRELNPSERHICIFCDADMPFTHYARMERNPMSEAFNGIIERQTPQEAPREIFARAASLFYYNSETGYKYIPQALKYSGNIAAGRRFAAILGKELAESPLFADVDCVIPVPLHWTRRWRRGYNQAEIIAREVARAIGCGCRTNILRRKHRTRTQTTLSVDEKARNVADAFAVRRSSDGGFSHILLVDDVFTTGATMAACFAALRKVLPDTRISAATLAVVSS